MKEELVTDSTLREFLLGKLDDDERQRIEDLFLTDSQARERVLTAEQDLIEDYLEDSLTKADKERFVSLYARTDEQRRKLKITKSLKDWALTEAQASQAVPVPVSVWSRFRRQLRLKPVLVVPIAVTIVIAIVLAILWLNSRMEQRKHLVVEQELAQLNSSSSLREVPPQMISLELRPGTVRSVELEPEFNRRADVPFVELRLRWTQNERYSRYQAEIRRPDESFTVASLQAENDSGPTIRVRLPTHMLRRGQYQIRLTGIDNNGNTGLAEQYSFAVAD
jgi:hypothetical protein